MRSTYLTLLLVAAAAVLAATASTQAQVGEPASFDIAVKQGAQLIATKHVNVATELPDLRTDDGTPESFVKLITQTASGLPTPIILKVVSEPSQDPALYRLLHFYIDVPLSMTDIDHPGAVSLFDPNSNDQIDVSVANMIFNNGVNAQPRLENNPFFYTSFMRDYQGHFYQSTMTHPYDWNHNGIIDIQVPATAYLDGDTSKYTFNSNSGVASSWTWGNIVNPGQNTNVHTGFQGDVTPVQKGYVFELGLAVGFVAIPEPATASLLLLGTLVLCRPSRRRRA
jgi:hypothetical protein